MGVAGGWDAVVVACGAHGRPGAGDPPGLVRVAGLSVIERTVLTARHDGAAACLVVADPAEKELVSAARAAWGEGREGFRLIAAGPGWSASDAVRAAAAAALAPVVGVLPADLAFSRNLLQGLLRDWPQAGESAIAAVGDSGRWPDDDSFHLPTGDGRRHAGLALLATGVASGLTPGVGLAAALSGLPAGTLRLREMANSFTFRLRSPADRAPAEARQVRALRRNTDGIVSRWLNRPVSLFLSRYLFSRSPLSPNQITFVTALVAWAAIAIVLLRQQPVWLALAALLFHLSSVLDGCDGEVARLRFQFTRFGEWWDNLLDECNNALFLASLGIGSWLAGGPDWHLWGGVFYVGAVWFCDAAVFWQLIRWRGGTGNVEKFRWFFQGRDLPPAGDPTAWPERRSLTDLLLQLPRRDFFIFVMLIFALFGRIIWMFHAAVASGVILLLLGVVQWGWQLRQEREERP